MKIYIGNMSYSTTEDQLRQAFEAFGEVSEVNLVMDRDSGRPKGFAFVEMPNQDEGKAAIAAMNGKEFDGRTLNVDEARPRREGAGGGGGGRGGRGGFGGGGGGNRRGGW
ncbi:MAG TPA: RNA-binding protein [candidate division Zixibacteria bacterium]|nr:RNA-binding protein [candidate division Zixibacteria bacterium]MDD4916809.1 RNA-binding protein [candidate division Zixibacteria bacterium]HOD65189.1 RNA-binding protein [candidate division Zixibacteria bacterium]HPI33014.1 RNA-binding protein [candidate division Zixibacteria bacterium]HPM36484.1 RNA-binding protein [candidate division Zixibacteria bacterium]